MLDDKILSSFIYTFYGFGTYKAPYWFVGMEEGGGDFPESVARSITGWYQRGSPELRDPRGYDPNPDTSTSPWFRRNPKLQTTWKQLIRITLVAQGRSPATNDIRAYQRDYMGRLYGNMCLLELLPLPSPSIGRWHYNDNSFSSFPYLSSRETYMNYLAPSRAQHIREQVRQYTPKAVVFYGFDWRYQQWWKLIAGVPFQSVEVTGGNIFLARTPVTTFAIVKHPASKGITNKYFDEVGRHLLTASS